MSSLLDRSDQAISITELARSAKRVFDRLTSGRQDRYVVMRNNTPAAVVLPVQEYEALLDELDELRVEAVAAERLESFNHKQAVSHDDMRHRFSE